jgi:hypothetical protein
MLMAVMAVMKIDTCATARQDNKKTTIFHHLEQQKNYRVNHGRDKITAKFNLREARRKQ